MVVLYEQVARIATLVVIISQLAFSFSELSRQDGGMIDHAVDSRRRC